jgi:hypothetical protein
MGQQRRQWSSARIVQRKKDIQNGPGVTALRPRVPPVRLRTHLKGEVHVVLYALDGDRCWWLAADFDGADGMTDALMYIKAARRCGCRRLGSVSTMGVVPGRVSQIERGELSTIEAIARPHPHNHYHRD